VPTRERAFVGDGHRALRPEEAVVLDDEDLGRHAIDRLEHPVVVPSMSIESRPIGPETPRPITSLTFSRSMNAVIGSIVVRQISRLSSRKRRWAVPASTITPRQASLTSKKRVFA